MHAFRLVGRELQTADPEQDQDETVPKHRRPDGLEPSPKVIAGQSQPA